MTVGLYKGFSSFQFEYNKSFKLLDIECVKRDLLNHFFARLNERVMLPQFGILTSDLLFEPLDPSTVSTIHDDMQTVITYDPRVELAGTISVTPDYNLHQVTAFAPINYIELGLTGIFDINLQFDS